MSQNTVIRKKNALKGEITVPGDKSISHRAIMFGALAQGMTEIDGFLEGADCLSTISCFKKMGVDIQRDGSKVKVYGSGLHGLKKPSDTLDVGNSGTTTRLISGILAGQSFVSTLNGDASIQKRPMKRIMDPLRKMGADITSIHQNDCAPLRIAPASTGLHGIDYISPVASAQVKSCVLLAGLYASGKTSVTEPLLSRNHTELMLSAFGADIHSIGLKTTISPDPILHAQKILVPGDISSAAYFIAAALITENSQLLIKNVNINPTRAGILKVAEAMGGNITYENKRIISNEEVADLYVRSSALHGTNISGEIIPTLIDEIPVIAIMAAYASGKTTIADAAELKVKESDRITVVTENLKDMGCDITPTEDGMIINGGSPLHGAVISTHMDHRIAMAFAVAGLNANGETSFDDATVVDISYPHFFNTLSSL
ncbi:MAG: 3-phosphoshikimate 1-carboxyvinyltransferase [Lachnospiraceae bacterium]|nr:3-phosphoshikimate 1-carboxyvinyltransferase [Lachnospiraceae bacterium]